MPSAVVPMNALALGPGFLYWAPLLTTLPANTVAGSVFTDPWPGAWLLLGATDKGSEFAYELSTDNVEVAESLDPVAYVSTGRASGMSFDLANVHATNMKRAMNGGTLTVTGSGGTTLSKLTPPDVGAEVRAMIGWESQDNTERLIGYQSFQIGKLAVNRRKGSDKALLACEFRFEKPSAGAPFDYWTAGTVRG
jgi:hypothetical protein